VIDSSPGAVAANRSLTDEDGILRTLRDLEGCRKSAELQLTLFVAVSAQ
jgi:hypothetical protein